MPDTPRAEHLAQGTGAWTRLLRRAVPVEPHETRAMLWSAALFFLVLASYYVIRPVRETMGVQGGVEKLPEQFTATFVVMLLLVPAYSAVVARWPRRVFIPWVLRGFAGCLVAFFAALEWLPTAALAIVARIFYVWAAVFSLFVVSMFWEFMVDVWRREQSGRLFGFIAAGGSVGALLGPLWTGWAAPRIGHAALLLIAAVGLELAVVCVRRVVASAPEAGGASYRADDDAPIGGGIWAGFTLAVRTPRLLGICGYVGLLSMTGTILYFEQQHIVAAAIATPVEQTVLFARIDLAVNGLTIAMQVLAFGRLLPKIGLGAMLAALPLVSAAGLVALAAAPVLATVVAVQICRRAADYALAKPAREVLFTQVGREAKYKAKSFIDTVVYRGGDTVSAWLFRGLSWFGLGLAGVALVAAPVAALWAAFGLWLGRSPAGPPAERPDR
jgi:AAA family ATP:ADP antiporter